MPGSIEERLAKKRLAERRRKARIKSNPELYALHKEKDRQRYYKRKKEGKIKSVSQLDSRQHKIARERSRCSSNKHNLKRKFKELRCLDEDLIALPEETVETNDPLASSQSNILKLAPPNIKSFVDDPIASSSIPRRIDAHESSAPLSPSSDVSLMPRMSTRSSVRSIAREFSPTPRVDKKPNKKVIRRLKYRMKKMYEFQKEKIDKLKAINARYKQQIYRLKSQNAAKKNINKVSKDSGRNLKEKIKLDGIKQMKNSIEKDVKSFLEEDENSRMCSGKKEFVTKNKDKKQKRYLNDSLKDLHSKFVQSDSERKISYSSFCRKRPFWILKPNVNKRETCLCIEHENMKLMISALKRGNLIHEKSTKDILSSLCCDPSNILCLTRKCEICNNKNIIYKEFDNSKELFYSVWQKSKVTYNKNGFIKNTFRTVKDKVSTFPRDIILRFEKNLPSFMTHCGIWIAQNRYIKKIKTELTDEECIIHCDFSQNYYTKYANEIQAVHFGGNRQQITLHTVVIYYRKNSILKVQSICTLSESLRHDAPAIWEHLLPILKFIEDEDIPVNTLHFISDSPSGQYRNRKMFYIISKLHWHLPSLSSITWNYTESGHGKGAPDGVGAILKRKADQKVAEGNDITSLSTLMAHLKSVQGIITMTVNESGMYEKELLIPTDLESFAGTMKVNQAVWNANTPNQLSLRRMSCAEGDCKYNSVPCKHGQHIGLFVTVKTTNRHLIGRAHQHHHPNKISKQSDIGIDENDSFWAQVSSDCENIAPKVMKEVLSTLARNDSSSDEEFRIF